MNKEEEQYLDILRKIIIYNSYDEVNNDIITKLNNNEINLKDAYEELLKRSSNNLVNVMDENKIIWDRTGTGTYKIFGETMRFDLNKSFPLLTTKKVFTKSIFEELFWFISGDTNIKRLVDNNVPIWNINGYEHNFNKYRKDYEDPTMFDLEVEEYAKRIKEDGLFAQQYGDLGPVYGAQWRNFGGHHHEDVKGVDQLNNLLNSLVNDPNSRRHLLYAYNPQEVDLQALPACHAAVQFYVNNNKLSCKMDQRSADMFLGVPFNIASYALFTNLIGKVTNLEMGEFIHNLGDTHIYQNHVEQVQLQLSREPYPFPQIEIEEPQKEIESSLNKLESYNRSHVKILKYNHHPAIRGRMS